MRKIGPTSTTGAMKMLDSITLPIDRTECASPASMLAFMVKVQVVTTGQVTADAGAAA